MTFNKLERNLSPLGVWALALGCMIGWGAFVMPGDLFLPTAGPLGTALALLAAIIIFSLIAFNYSYMMGQFPDEGGEFSYARCVFGPRHGFLCAWFLTLSYLCIVPLNATALGLVSHNLLHDVLSFGASYTVYGYTISQGDLLASILAIAIPGGLAMLNVRLSAIFQIVLVALLILAVLMPMAVGLGTGAISLQSLQPLFNPERSTLYGIIAVLAILPWAFIGFDTVPQSTEEFRFPLSQVIRILIGSIVLGALIYALLTVMTASQFPDNYASWYEYIKDIPSLRGIEALPTFYAANQILGATGLTVMSVGVICAIFSGIVGFLTAASRLLLSIARARYLPSWFAEIHPDYHTPHHAIAFVIFASLVAPFFGRVVLGWIVELSALGAAIAYGYTSAAALRQAYRECNYLIISTGFLGIIFACVFVFLLLVPIPALRCSLSIPAYILLGIWVVAGVIFYTQRRRWGHKG